MEGLCPRHVGNRLYSGNHRVKLAIALVLSAFVGLFAPGIAHAGNTYTIQELGPVPGNENSLGFAINESGATVGFSYPFGAGYQTAFLNNGVSTVGLVDPFSTTPLSDAYGINSSGHVVGDVDVDSAGGARNGFLYTGTSWTDLGSLAGRKGGSWAYAINNHDIVVGASNTTTKYAAPSHAVWWDASGRVHDLGTLPGDTGSQANGINNLGGIVGSSSSNSTSHAFYYNGTSMQNIGGLGGSGASAAAINDYTHIVGTAQNPSGQWDAFLYENGNMLDLGPGEATAINFYDQVVGDTQSDATCCQGLGGHPFLYEDGHTVDLNTLIPANSGWDLRTARGINNAGQIVGTGLYKGEWQAYRLDLTLLGKWAPLLRYDQRESFRADSPAEMTDYYDPGVGSNLLINGGNGDTIAAADPSYPEDALSLGFLGNVYGNGITSIPEDYTDEFDGTGQYAGEPTYYALEAGSLHGNPVYANQTQAIELANDTQIFLQYWFFYYYNDRTDTQDLGNHEGDWEMIQVALDKSTGNPVAVTASQHQAGEFCEWNHVQRTADNHPIIYVAYGSHANYFSSGTHLSGIDVANGNGESLIPIVESLDPAPSWLTWPGQWGGSMGGSLPGEESSPTGPAFHSQWGSGAVMWEVNANACTEQQTYETSKQGMKILRHAPSEFGTKLPTAPFSTLPAVHARRVGDRAVISYYFQKWPTSGELRPSRITTSVKSSGNRYPPLTVISPVRGRGGRVSQPIGFGHGPFRILVSVFTRNNQSSRVISVPLR